MCILGCVSGYRGDAENMMVDPLLPFYCLEWMFIIIIFYMTRSLLRELYDTLTEAQHEWKKALEIFKLVFMIGQVLLIFIMWLWLTILVDQINLFFEVPGNHSNHGRSNRS